MERSLEVLPRSVPSRDARLRCSGTVVDAANVGVGAAGVGVGVVVLNQLLHHNLTSTRTAGYKTPNGLFKICCRTRRCAVFVLPTVRM